MKKAQEELVANGSCPPSFFTITRATGNEAEVAEIRGHSRANLSQAFSQLWRSVKKGDQKIGEKRCEIKRKNAC